MTTSALRSHLVLIATVILSVSQWQCSDNKEDQQGGIDGRTPLEKAFDQAASTHHIPVRFLIASGYLESKLRPKETSSNTLKGPELGESAFGISRSTLGLQEGLNGDRLTNQVDAYSRWLARQLGGGLKFNPKDDEEKFNWIWAIADAHRRMDSTKVLFANEMIKLLNSGFYWIDPETDTVIPFPPETPAIDLENLKTVSGNYLNLSSLTFDSPNNVMFAKFLKVYEQGSHDRTQDPSKIKIVHCPFSFSACVELQAWNGEDQKDFWMGAHYIIPSDHDVSSTPLQLALHNQAVPMTDTDGSLTFSLDEVVVMLTGASGKVSNGIRNPADPLWMNPRQFQSLRTLTDLICDRLAYHHQDLTRQQCLETGSGTIFKHQKAGEAFQWGQIPDYDPVIFESYIGSRNTLSGKTVFEFPGNKKIYQKGETVSLNLTFGLQAYALELERLIRCPDSERVSWSVIARELVTSQNNFVFEKKLFGSGPNLNGTQFFRAKIFDAESKLLGWDLATIYLKDFNKEPEPVFPNDCLDL